MGLPDGDVNGWVMEALRLLGSTLTPPEVQWTWNPKLRSTAGRAIMGRQRIELNPHVFSVDEAREELRRTVFHEVCHLEAHRKIGFREPAHGPTWQDLMRRVGLAPDRCHTLERGVRRVRRRSYPLACEVCGKTVEVGAVRLRRILRGGEYRHTGCGGRIWLAPAAPAAPSP